MFTRVFSSILDSSINVASVPPSVRWLWITMLLIADDEQTGVVDMPVERLAARAGLTIEQTQEALDILSSPDLDSTTEDFEGRRLLPLDSRRNRGWKLVNYEKYKQIANTEQKRESTRLRVAKHRERGGSENGDRHAFDTGDEIPDAVIPTQAPTPDFASTVKLMAKVTNVGLKVEPPEQLVHAWVGRFGVELVEETIDDVLGDLSGKHFNYLQSILQSRKENPAERPGNRVKRSQAIAKKDSNGGMIGPDGIHIPARADDYWD